MTARKKTAKRPAAKKTQSKKKASKRPAKKKTPAKKKGAGGRPSKFKPEFQTLARQFAELGATDAQMAKNFGVTEQTFNNWKKTHPEFFESLKDGKTIADDAVEQSLFHRATGYSHPEDKILSTKFGVETIPTIKHYPPDTTACIFWLKNRRGGEWRDKFETEHSGAVAGGMAVGIPMDEKAWLVAAKRQQEIMRAGIGE